MKNQVTQDNCNALANRVICNLFGISKVSELSELPAIKELAGKPNPRYAEPEYDLEVVFDQLYPTPPPCSLDDEPTIDFENAFDQLYPQKILGISPT